MRRKLVGIGAALAAAVAVTGIAVGVAHASIPDTSGVIHACYKTPVPAHGSPLEVIDTDTGGSCGAGSAELTWQQKVAGSVASTLVTVPANSTYPARVYCPPGEAAVSGGYSNLQGSDLRVYASVPGDSLSPTVWIIGFENPSSEDHQVWLYAVCLEGGVNE